MSNRKMLKKRQENIESDNRNNTHNKKENVEWKIQKVQANKECRKKKHVKGKHRKKVEWERCLQSA